MKTCALFAALLLAIPAFPQSKIDFLQLGRSYTEMFYEGKAAEIWQGLSPDMKKVFSEPGGILGMQLGVKGDNGDETTILSERVLLEQNIVLYQRVVMYQKITSPMMVEWDFDQSGVVVGFFIRANVAADTQYLDYKDQAALRLPFKGNWLVTSGGRTVDENHHASSIDQRFADDIVAIRHNRTFSGEGTLLEQYYCYGRPILSPGVGTVVGVTNGIPDNPINAPFDSPPAGNFVVIDLGNSEYVFLAHLKLGSIRVKIGDKVQPGQRIGKCGNSGNSPIPHLHIHMQTTPELFKGEGLPLQFQNLLVDKKFVSATELERGQIVSDKTPDNPTH